ncbi:MAG: RNA-binding cell elongation regulator Jag/EloR [Bacillota bacterium]|nr:RNA-binding cell elongation regulator Jag/EloR [Bacillota bacterium]NLU55737.1 protein jag [Bacillota bacterium]HOA91615.1 RNA-binding cell elongation regulator Jag/EloR [Bacillota bacterium]HOJ45908.1 RNA-binding cell elongation regulator Jag/EloR [Bacillota bacterium]HOP53289.1 RNA-binding cell elongation regulator Jag/EloR [Bacillota bacterium]
MIKVEQTAKTVDEAIEIVLSQYNVTRDDIKVTVVDEGKKGFLGIGTKEAKIIVEIKEESEKKQERALEFVKSVVEKMGLNAEIDIKEEDGTLFVNIESPDVGVVIGRRGETLDSLQYLTGLVVNKDSAQWTRVILDASGYRKRREESLVDLAKKKAQRVKHTKRKLSLEPMNPQERRIIHTALQDDPQVTTFSEGEEPYRRVVIALKK